MALVKWIFDTQTGSPTIGAIKCTVTPYPFIYEGWATFKVIAPNGVEISSYNPLFDSSPATQFDIEYPSGAAATGYVVPIPLDANGAYMNGKYVVSIKYVMNGGFPVGGIITQPFTDSQTHTVEHIICLGTPNFAKLAYHTNPSGQLVITDTTDYTGLIISSHTISSVSTGGTPVLETSYTQILPIGSYTSILTANVSKDGTTTDNNVTTEDVFTLTASGKYPANLDTYQSTVTKVKARLKVYDSKLCKQRHLSNMDTANWLCLVSKLTVLNADFLSGNDITDDLKELNNLVK